MVYNPTACILPCHAPQDSACSHLWHTPDFLAHASLQGAQPLGAPDVDHLTHAHAQLLQHALGALTVQRRGEQGMLFAELQRPPDPRGQLPNLLPVMTASDKQKKMRRLCVVWQHTVSFCGQRQPKIPAQKLQGIEASTEGGQPAESP